MAGFIPNNNPFNIVLAKQSAIWSYGIRNNQGFAYDSVRNILYGSSHGPHSDDEVNIIEPGMNYGHPLVEGYSWDDNYNGSSAGFPGSSLPVIADESDNAAALGANYRDPIFSGYPSTQAVINNIYLTSPGNGGWPSEGWSGLGLYNYSAIPGWKNSLIMSGLKWGRLIRTKLNSAGTALFPTAGDSVCYFDSNNRYRDIAFSRDGKDIFVVMDNNSATSGPGANNPSIVGCAGCLQKFTFLGYNSNGTTSMLPDAINIAPGKANACENLNTVTINAANNNNNLWVPITDTLGNIVAEINALGKNLGTVTSSVWINSGAVREISSNKALYLDRSITITPQTQPGGNVRIRFYLTTGEFTALKNAFNSASQPSGIANISNVSLFKNSDVGCNDRLNKSVSIVNTTLKLTRAASNGYVLDGTISSFSTFFVASSLSLLPSNLLTFKGALQNDVAQLQWLTENENGTKSYVVERSVDGKDFDSVGLVSAKNASGKFTYYFNDANIRSLSSPVIYYRLKLTDLDGQYRYSGVVKVNISFITGTINVRPNPVASETVLDVFAAADEKANWTLTDINGKTVMQRSIQIRKGDNSFNINISNLPAGMYYLKVNSNSINQAVKVQKL